MDLNKYMDEVERLFLRMIRDVELCLSEELDELYSGRHIDTDVAMEHVYELRNVADLYEEHFLTENYDG